MPYVDQNTPVIERITLPSGNSYYIADREIRNKVKDLEDTVAGGVAFIIAWDGNSTPVVANIPKDVSVVYNDTVYTGTLSAETTGSGAHAQAGAFYLVKSSTQTGFNVLQWQGGNEQYLSETLPNIKIDLNTFLSRVTLRPDDKVYSLEYWTEQDVHTGSTDYGWEVTTDQGQQTQRFNGKNCDYLGISGLDEAHAIGGPDGQFMFEIELTSSTLDIYDEYVPIGSDGSKIWEKIGDTAVDLTNVVTNVTLSNTTTTVIGSNATLTVPAYSLDTEEQQGDVTVLASATPKYLQAEASGGGVAWNSKDQKTVLTGVKVTTQPTVTLTANASNPSGATDIPYVESISPSSSKLKATVSGGGVGWGSKDTTTVLTGLGTATTSDVASSVTPTTKKLTLGSVTGVQANTTTASKATTSAAQTTATGGWTAINPSNTDANSNGNPDVNENLLANISVSNGVLTIGAATLNTQSTPQYTFSDVTVPIKATSATTVATGGVTTTGSGADVVTDVAVGDTVAAVTGYANPTTDTVIGTGATLTHTNPSVALDTDTSGDVTVITGLGTITTKHLTAAASGTAVGANGTANVIGASSTFTPTQPTITLTAGATSADGQIAYIQDVTSEDLVLRNSGTNNVTWTNKDTKNVLNSATLTVTKGNNE